tara:strand:- start:931 stop:1620 length:690 start_codon:yes stop_codon:yes gene_type:complete
MKFGVVVFPGTWSDTDCYRVVDEVLQQEVEYVWHKDTQVSDFDCLILPGGFSYGDYLRCGAIARFSPVMDSVEKFAKNGGLVIGICNGFQILCESGLLPGVLRRNDHLQFRCEWVNLRVENTDSPFSSKMVDRQVVRIPISHGEGNYFASDSTLEAMEDNGQILFRYSSDKGELLQSVNPNGSLNNIAGITNEEGNVLGMMPHPERCCDPILGGDDGLLIFESIKDYFD